ncbi:MAG: malto-oligosyltrehalose synthase, partial [Acidimicrobiales bacterium]
APAVGAGPPAPPAGVADELESIAAALGNLPPSWATDRESVRARHRDKEVLRARLAELCADEPAVAAAVDAELAAVNADPEALDALLERQNYRLAYWRAAGQEVDYRRFFDIDSLVGVRIEDEAVFQDSHALVLSWLHDGVVDGLRIDHIDGLRDPEGYLHRLRTAAGDAWIVVEKVLEPGERLRDTWPVAGTTGYDFCALVGGLFVDPAGEAPLTELWERLSGSAEPFAEVAHAAKHAAMAGPLATDLARLTALLVRVGEGRRRYRDYTRAELAATLEEVVACLGVYRTYVGEVGPAHPDDAARVLEAVAEAARRREDLDPDLLDGLARILLADETMAGDAETELRLRFQQVAGPVMAKGVEDTALYRYCRFVGRNEVGSDPGRWATPAGELHAACAATQGRWPTTMVTTSTHDTKRSEDVRARLAVLSEMAAAWAERASAWRERNAGYRTGSDPDAGAEYLLYQTMVGAWPIDADRMVAYMAKATKEAKLRTSWTDPDPAYDGALERFVRGVMGDDGFVEDLSSFVDCRLKESGWASSLAQTLVALTAPGVPDTYQGCELWDYSLVDPDNRRPVDFARRRRLLAELPSLSPEECWERAAEGLPKLLVTQRALHLRRERPQWWGAAGSYRPLAARGPQADRVVAFVRAGSAATVVPRLAWGLYREGLRAAHPQAQQPVAWARLQAGAPGCTIAGLPGYLSTALLGTTVELPSGRWRNVLTGDHLSGGAAGVGEMLHRFPVALLAREG